MQNTGTTTWSAPYGYKLGSQNPRDNTTWGTTRMVMPAGTSVPPGANATFTLNATAPSAPGTYNYPVAPGQNVTFGLNVTPAASGNLDFQWRMADAAASFGEPSANLAVAVGAPDNAQFVSQVVPSSLAPGQAQLVSVTMKNTGSTTWSAGSGYKLGSQNPQDNTTWGAYRVELPYDVPPGQNAAFAFPVTAPQSAGTYEFQWKMIREGAGWFGALTNNVAINVQASQGAGISYIHVDHLNTPRLVANAAGTTVWKWDQQEPFGVNVPDENPSGLGAFDLPLRLPGQYFDKETGLAQNWHRDYSSAEGRYIQSDPIGLRGGINTFLYALASPLKYIDPDGAISIAPALPRPVPGLLPRPIPGPVDPVLPAPGKRDTVEHCTRLYVRCITERWGGDWTCGQCHFYCTGINEVWPFEHCSPDLPDMMASCPAPGRRN